MSMFKKKQHDVPQLNTASLPDLIFSVLFFFMIVTHMRTDNSKVRYSLPKGMSLANLHEKKALCSISIGKLLTPNVPPNEQPTVIEVNGKPVTKEQLTEAINTVKRFLSPCFNCFLASLIASVNCSFATGLPFTSITVGCSFGGTLGVNSLPIDIEHNAFFSCKFANDIPLGSE